MLTLLLAVAIANPSAEATSPTAVRVHAVLTGEGFAPSVFYRVTGSRIWSAVGMRSEEGTGGANAAIPRPAGKELEYFLEAWDPEVKKFARAGSPQQPLRFPTLIRVAVLEFETAVPSLDRISFSDQVRAAGTSLRGVSLITRENMVQLLGGKPLSECEGECEVETGRRMGADYVVTGRLTKVGARFKLSLRLHRTADGAEVSTGNVSGRTPEALDDSLNAAVGKLFAPLSDR